MAELELPVLMRGIITKAPVFDGEGYHCDTFLKGPLFSVKQQP